VRGCGSDGDFEMAAQHKNMNIERWKVALHEAAHAVVAVLSGLLLSEVSVDSDDGGTSILFAPDPERGIPFYLAGEVADAMLVGQTLHS
jgi:Peptidase M50B-like